MEKSLSFKIAACLLVITGCFVYVSSFAFISQKADGKDIWIVQKPTVPPGAPHMPAYNPFYAELVSTNVILGSYSSYGIVDVSLTSTAGDDYSTVFDTADGTIIIPISGNTGDYTLLITTASGLEFIGEFSI
ncbi:MAG: hypothetical protein IKR72_02520 [Bacteroidales bacterium]|nr:hypothetical protein [Bacteroidales bacterium]